MISILLVDDEAEKTRVLAEVLMSVPGVTTESIETAGDVVSAKRALSRRKVDLVVLDIKLPSRLDRNPDADGGLDILRWLKGAGRRYAPEFIIGTTAYTDAFETAEPQFKDSVWHLVQFRYDSDEWVSLLKHAVTLIMERNIPPFQSDGSTYRTDVAIVTALKDPELSAVLGLPADWKRMPVQHDTFEYYAGSFPINGRQVSVTAVAAPLMGLPCAGVTATKLIYSFRPRYLVMTGITCGIKDKVNIGDVLLADPCWDWGSGKIRKSGKSAKLHPAAYQHRVDERIRSAVSQLKADPVKLAKIKDAWSGPRPSSELQLHIDAVASGGSVLQSKSAIAEIRSQHKNLIGVEMEIYSVMAAGAYAPEPRPLTFALKGVCDFGIEDKEAYDQYRPYAAYTSVAALSELLKDHLFSSS